MKKFVAALLLVVAFTGLVFAEEAYQVDYKKSAQASSARSAKLKEASPEMMGAFGNLASEVLKDGAVSLKTKELIALALSIQNRCESCITTHVQNAIKAGVTREELVDALGVVVLMGGGPNSAYAATVLEAYDQFSAK